MYRGWGGGEGWRAECFLGFWGRFCFKKGGPFFCNKERREERKRTKVRNIQRVDG